MLGATLVVCGVLTAVAAGHDKTVEIAPGVHMPVILLGTGYMGTPEWQNATVGPIVKAWLASGARGIDTAFVYNDQEGVTAAIKESGVPRSEIFITSKIPGVMNYSYATSFLQKDYEKLGETPIDLVLSHWCLPNGEHTLPGTECTPEHIRETWKAMEDFQKAGKVRAIGVSNYCVSHMQELLKHATVKPAVQQIERSPYFKQVEMTQFCKDHGIHLQSFAPLGDADRQSGSGPPAHALLNDATIVKIANAHKMTTAQVLLQWQVQGGHSAPCRIGGPNRTVPNLAHVEQNSAVSFGLVQNLTDSEMAMIDAMPEKSKCWPTAGYCPKAVDLIV